MRPQGNDDKLKSAERASFERVQIRAVCLCRVQIIEILDDSFYPGICRAVLVDYYNCKHFFVDKIPALAGVHAEDISHLPFDGYIRVEVIKDLGNAVEINTEKPDDLESEDGCYRFVVSKENIK